MELKKLKVLVIQTLTENDAVRGNDDLLYLEIIKKIHPHWNNGRINTDIQNASIGEFFTSRISAGLPSFESVSRCRRKAQEEIKGLKPCEKIRESRKRQEERFYNFATKQAEFIF